MEQNQIGEATYSEESLQYALKNSNISVINELKIKKDKPGKKSQPST